MKNTVITKAKQTRGKIFSKVKYMFLLAGITLTEMQTAAYANSGIPSLGSTTADSQAAGMVEQLVDIVFSIFRWVGVLLLAWSVAQLVMAFKNEDADSKTKAMTMAIVSIVLVSLKSIFSQFNLI